MQKRIIELEKRFFKHRYISDEGWLLRTLHEDFCECGKSGRIFYKEETVKSLLLCTGDRPIDASGFTCSELAPGCISVNYITNENGRRFFRTSLWVGEEPQLRFHQATMLTE